MKHLALVVLVTLTGAPAAFAQSTPPHDDFFVRGRAGAAYWDASGNGFDTYGPGWFFSLDIGGAIRPGLQLYGQVRDVLVDNPQQSNNGGPSQTLDKNQFNMPAVGFGASYYFMPLELYVGATILVAQNTDDYTPVGPTTISTSTDWGLGASVDVGKEWRLFTRWGLGVGGDLFVASMSQTDPTNPSRTYQVTTSGIAAVVTVTHD